MTSARKKVISQLELYRKHNLNYLNSRTDPQLYSLPLDEVAFLPSYLNLLVPAYLTSIPQLVSSFLQLPKENDRSKQEFRSTSSEEMDASNYNVDAKLENLNRVRASTRKSLNRESKAHFSTRPRIFTILNPVVRKMRETNLPTDRLSRAATLAGLIVNVASAGTRDAVNRCIRGEYKDILKNSLTSDEVIMHVVECLCKMRGTALKFGQLFSMQADVVPERFRQALISSRHEADIMSRDKVEEIMSREFGERWMEKFSEFNFQPMASASLGQAHRAKLKDGTDVAVKIQFPGILDSIDSDLDNLVWILTYTKLVPPNFFLNQYTKELRTEIFAECDYHNEARFYDIFRKLKLEGFFVPRVFYDLTTKKVITTEFVKGVPVEDLKDKSPEVRNSVGYRILRLSLSEIFVFELMNTDPNPSNYLYDEESDLIGLVDFGSCRIYDRKFVKQYSELVLASVREDYDQIMNLSLEVGFLHPEDTPDVVQAHIDSVEASAEPFKYDMEYEFANSILFSTCMDRSKVILTNRKKPPPPEIYSLHRKLAGAFLISKILSAKYNSKRLFDEVMAMARAVNVT